MPMDGQDLQRIFCVLNFIYLERKVGAAMSFILVIISIFIQNSHFLVDSLPSSRLQDHDNMVKTIRKDLKMIIMYYL